jgi:hypothetical protein
VRIFIQSSEDIAGNLLSFAQNDAKNAVTRNGIAVRMREKLFQMRDGDGGNRLGAWIYRLSKKETA